MFRSGINNLPSFGFRYTSVSETFRFMINAAPWWLFSLRGYSVATFHPCIFIDLFLCHALPVSWTAIVSELYCLISLVVSLSDSFNN